MSDRTYDACWIPGLDDEDHWDDCVLLGLDWLQSTAFPGDPVIVLNAKSMIQNRQELGWAAQRYDVVAPTGGKSRSPASNRRPRAVLAVWPSGKALDLADELARNGALCVIPGSLHEVDGWIMEHQAVNLLEPDAPVRESPLPPEVRKELDFLAAFGGHNNFSSTEKPVAIRTLRKIAARDMRPDGTDIEQYLMSTGKVRSSGGAERIRQWYEGVCAGKGFRDYSGRPI